MPDDFLKLSATDRKDALEVAAHASGRPAHLLEKDVWVVWALQVLFGSTAANHLVFKGGTSLSKAYGAIRRFSEDVDLTYDIRAIAGDLTEGRADALPPNRSQEKKWTKAIKERLADWVAGEALTIVQTALDHAKLAAKADADGDKIHIHYEPTASGTGYVRPAVLLEFGARSTGEPWETKHIVCDAAMHLADVTFPEALVRTMCVERTFWEKATAMHVFCAQGTYRGAERFARHWYDLVRLNEAGFAELAIAARDIAAAVARHKSIFFAEKDADGQVIDYEAAIGGKLCLVPEGQALERLAEDYAAMVRDGLLLDDADSFDTIMAHCRVIQDIANKTTAR
jgi:hypothetical protein